jgi:MSHA biogenesis protein MshN
MSHLNSHRLKLPFVKMSGLLALLASGTYLNSQAQAQNNAFSLQVATFVESEHALQTNNHAPSRHDIESPIFKPKLIFETKLSRVPAVYQAPTKQAKKEVMLANLAPATKSDAPATIINAIVEPAPEAIIRKQVGVAQKSANDYRQALTYLQQGRVSEAQASLSAALDTDAANHEARQMLAGLLLDNHRHDEARTTLAAGLAIAPEQTDFRIALARLQVEAGDITEALNTLEQGLPFAKNYADYLHFFATLLQRANRHEEAIAHYTSALSLNTTTPAGTLIGLGISLQATGKLAQSQEAFTLVQTSATLNPELALFVEQRIKQINQSLQN